MGKLPKEAKILVLCLFGGIRSPYISDILRKRGYSVDYGGVDELAVRPLEQDTVDNSDIIIFAHPDVTQTFMERFNPVDSKKSLELQIEDVNPKKRRGYEQVYSDIEESLNPYLD